MSGFVPFTDCAEVVIKGSLAAQSAFLTLGFTKAGGYSSTDLQDLADGVANWVTGDLLTFLVDDLSIAEVVATDLSSDSAPVAVSTVGLPASGAITGVPVPNNVALVVSFKTAARGRSFRGRNYVPSCRADSMVNSTQFTTAYAGDIQGAYEAMALTLGAIGNTHVVLSRFHDNTPRVTGVATPVTAYLGRQAVGTQRRRVIGHGS